MGAGRNFWEVLIFADLLLLLHVSSRMHSSQLRATDLHSLRFSWLEMLIWAKFQAFTHLH